MNEKIDKLIEDITIIQIKLGEKFRDYHGTITQTKEIKELQKAIEVLKDIKHIL